MEIKNFDIYLEDRESFKLRFEDDLKKKRVLNLFCSFTFITSNYSIFFNLKELKKISSTRNYKIFIVVLDTNAVANLYFKKFIVPKQKINLDLFVDQKIKELRNILISLGFKEENFFVYKSSELWRRLLSLKEEDLFLKFYTILAQMQIKKFADSNKISHLVQIPMDLFFCNFFHLLFPEDTNTPMNLALLNEHKENLYTTTRELMVKEGLIKNINPLFIALRRFPYLLKDSIMPEWDMSFENIKEFVVKHKLTRKEINQMFRFIFKNSEDILPFNIKNDVIKIKYNIFEKEQRKLSLMDLKKSLAKNLFNYLQEYKKKYLETINQFQSELVNISIKDHAKKIGKILKSEIALKIILLADGTKNTSEIAKEIGKSITTISTYIHELKKENFVRVIPKGKIKRTVKGIKINFEVGLQ